MGRWVDYKIVKFERPQTISSKFSPKSAIFCYCPTLIMALSQYSMNWASSLCSGMTNFFHSTRIPQELPQVTVIRDVQIWDGEQLLNDKFVTIVGQNIVSVGGSSVPKNSRTVQGAGGFLMPGLIDSHFHVATVMDPATFQFHSENHLRQLVHSGVTTGFDMGSFNSSNMPQFEEQGNKGLPSLLWSGAAACESGGFPSVLPGFPHDSIVNSNESATHYAETRISEGADYLKIFINAAGKPEQEYQEIIKKIADGHNMPVVSHAPDFIGQEIARNVGGKFITHVPKDKALNETGVQQMLDNNQIAIPTLIMSRNLIPTLPGHGYEYKYSNDSVALMYAMNVTILVGTDASAPVGYVGYCDSIHTEMKLLHDAGMSTKDILRGATSLPAEHFSLTNRGRIAPGMRADLLLLKKNPLVDITNSNTIKEVWTAGTVAYKNPF